MRLTVCSDIKAMTGFVKRQSTLANTYFIFIKFLAIRLGVDEDIESENDYEVLMCFLSDSMYWEGVM